MFLNDSTRCLNEHLYEFNAHSLKFTLFCFVSLPLLYSLLLQKGGDVGQRLPARTVPGSAILDQCVDRTLL